LKVTKILKKKTLGVVQSVNTE